MRATRVWRRVLGVEHTVIESVEPDGRGGEVVIARVRPRQGGAALLVVSAALSGL